MDTYTFPLLMLVENCLNSAGGGGGGGGALLPTALHIRKTYRTYIFTYIITKKYYLNI